jgi:hypothetical protein
MDSGHPRKNWQSGPEKAVLPLTETDQASSS